MNVWRNIDTLGRTEGHEGNEVWDQSPPGEETRHEEVRIVSTTPRGCRPRGADY